MDTITKSKKNKRKNSGFGSLKGMRSFTKADEFDSCIDKLIVRNKKLKTRISAN